MSEQRSNREKKREMSKEGEKERDRAKQMTEKYNNKQLLKRVINFIKMLSQTKYFESCNATITDTTHQSFFFVSPFTNSVE